MSNLLRLALATCKTEGVATVSATPTRTQQPRLGLPTHTSGWECS